MRNLAWRWCLWPRVMSSRRRGPSVMRWPTTSTFRPRNCRRIRSFGARRSWRHESRSSWRQGTSSWPEHRPMSCRASPPGSRARRSSRVQRWRMAEWGLPRVTRRPPSGTSKRRRISGARSERRTRRRWRRRGWRTPEHAAMRDARMPIARCNRSRVPRSAFGTRMRTSFATRATTGRWSSKAAQCGSVTRRDFDISHACSRVPDASSTCSTWCPPSETMLEVRSGVRSATWPSRRAWMPVFSSTPTPRRPTGVDSTRSTVDLVESTPVGRLGVGVEENTGIHARRDGHVALRTPDRTSSIVSLGGHQVEHVELASGTREQACEISKSLRVTEPHCAAFELHRPVVALVAKDVLIRVPKAERGTRLRLHLAMGILASLIAACSGVRQPLLRQRRLVRRSDLAPEMRRLFEVPEGGRCVTLGKPHSAMRQRCTRDERLALEPGGDARQLIGRCSGQLDVPCRQLDLDSCLQERRAPKLRMRRQFLGRNVDVVGQRITDGPRRLLDMTLGQRHQRQARLRIPTDLVSRPERFLRPVDVSRAQPDAAELRQRPPELSAQIGPKLFAGRQRFAL